MKFYYDLICPPSRAVLVFFKLANIPVEEIQVAIRKKEHLTDEFKETVGRHQRLPVFHDDDGFVLAESVAIMKYVAEKLKVAGPLYPESPQKRARVDEYLSWTHNNIRIAVAMFIYAKWLGQTDDQETIRFLENRLDNVLDEMDEKWLEDAYLTGDAMTVADIFGVCDLEQISKDNPRPEEVSGKDAFEGRDRLKNWYSRVSQQLQPHFQEIHRIVAMHHETAMRK